MFVKTNARTHMLIVLFLVHHPPRERLSKRFRGTRLEREVRGLCTTNRVDRMDLETTPAISNERCTARLTG